MYDRRNNYYYGSVVCGKYKVNGEAGKGAFARVLKVTDMHSGKNVALKILDREYARDAAREVEVLKSITRHDPDTKQRVCRMLSHFQWEGQPCIIFNLLGPSLRTRRFGSGDKVQLARLAKQLSSALQFLHANCRVIHTDLKPENILLDSADPSPHGLGDGWIICDLGSASFYTERADRELITTRPYRAPEVIVCSGWSYAADLYSLGVILYEVFTGRTLFECTRYCDSDHQHLHQMERKMGSLPSWLVNSASPRAKCQFFDGAGRLRPGQGMGPSQPLSTNGDVELHDLLTRLLSYDPVARIRADEVPHHPFITRQLGQPDTPVLASMPPSAYSSGSIVTPAAQQLRSGTARPPANKLLNKDEHYGGSTGVMGQPPAPRGRSNSLRPGAKERGGQEVIPLRDTTNRTAVLNTATKYVPRPRCGSAATGHRTGVAAAMNGYYDDIWAQRQAVGNRPVQNREAWLFR